MTLPPEPRPLGAVRFKQYDCEAFLTRYQAWPHPHAIILRGAPNTEYAGQPIATSTVYVEGAPLHDDEVTIKGYGENTAMEDALQKAGIIGPELRRVPTGFVTASVHKLLVKPLE